MTAKDGAKSLHAWLDKFSGQWDERRKTPGNDYLKTAALIGEEIRQQAADVPDVPAVRAKQLRQNVEDFAKSLDLRTKREPMQLAIALQIEGMIFAMATAAFFGGHKAFDR